LFLFLIFVLEGIRQTIRRIDSKN